MPKTESWPCILRRMAIGLTVSILIVWILAKLVFAPGLAIMIARLP